MPTYRISVPDNPDHTTGLSLDEAVEFAFDLGGFDKQTTRRSLVRDGRCELADDGGSLSIELEKPAHNFIYSAALLAEHQAAAELLRDKLGIKPNEKSALVDDELLNHPVLWSRTDFTLRCQRLSLWFRSECFLTLEEGVRLVDVPSISTLGD